MSIAADAKIKKLEADVKELQEAVRSLLIQTAPRQPQLTLPKNGARPETIRR